MKKSLFFFLIFFSSFYLSAQSVHYDLPGMLTQHLIATTPAHETKILSGSQFPAITTRGIVWLKGVDFTEGVVDLDLRGKNVFLNSFLGIAFYGSDTNHCDIIYFRPFNFRHTDSARWKWSVAYMQLPDFNYARLRKEHPGVYENRIVPAPDGDEWLHATIVIRAGHASVFVNHQSAASLEVTLLDGSHKGLFGLYSDGLTNDFANLTISKIIPGKTRDESVQQVKGINWLKDISFDTGTIELDLKGKNKPGESFLGIAFHGSDSSHCEVLYFRPFNFESPDSLHRQHMVQYMSLPDYDWQKLRNTAPGIFENTIVQAPHPDDWFHAKIQVTSDSVLVFVNHTDVASLRIKRFVSPGKCIGLWSDGLPGDFKNVVIRP